MKVVSIDVAGAVREIKAAIVRAQSRVAANANAEMLALYFGIGRYVSHKTKTEKWGTGVVDAISQQLQREMPGLRGFSARSIHKMRHFYEMWSEGLILPSVTAKFESAGDGELDLPSMGDLLRADAFLPSLTAKLNADAATVADFVSLSFTHHTEILDRTESQEERLFYVREAAQKRWSVRQLRESIRRDDFRHRGTLPNNFAAAIPDGAQARKTLAMFRDEYLLDFVNLDDVDAASAEDVDERVVEKSIVTNIRRFITEFGKDFSFIGNQYRVEAAGHEHFVDLLFFNRELNALVAVELKKGAFKPIYLGQLNLYLQALDDTVKKPHENASVGIILCQSADRPYVEYAVRDYNKPLGVATYKTADEMPERLKRALPPIDELRRQLEI